MEYCPKPPCPAAGTAGQGDQRGGRSRAVLHQPQKEALPATCLLRNARIGKPVCRPRGRDPQATGTACCGCSRRNGRRPARCRARARSPDASPMPGCVRSPSLARCAVGLGPVIDRAAKADHPRDQRGQFRDRDVLAGADVVDARGIRVLHQHDAGARQVVDVKELAQRAPCPRSSRWPVRPRGLRGTCGSAPAAWLLCRS